MLDELIATLLGTVRDMDPALRTAAAGLAILLETSVLLGLFVPGDTIVIVAASGVRGPVEWVATILAVVVGAVCGESVGFAIGRWFGPRIRTSWLGRRLGVDRLDAASRFLRRRGGVAVFLSRFVPVLHSLVPLVAGMGGMRYRTFVAWTAPACAVWATAYVSVSAGAATTYDELAGRLHGAGYVFIAIIAVFAVAALAGKRLLERRVARDAVAEPPAAEGAPAESSPERAGTEPSGPARADPSGDDGAARPGAST